MSKRDWSAAIEKVQDEAACRSCGRSNVKLELLGQNIMAWLDDRYPERPPAMLFDLGAAA